MTDCARCSGTVEDSDSLRLWNGRDYCSSCTKEVSPELLDDADIGAPLVVVDRYRSRRTIAVNLLLYASIPTVVFVAVFHLAGLDMVSEGKLSPIEAILLAVALSVGLNALVYFVAFIFAAFPKPSEQRLEVFDGTASYTVENMQAISGNWDDFVFHVHLWNSGPRLPL